MKKWFGNLLTRRRSWGLGVGMSRSYCCCCCDRRSVQYLSSNNLGIFGGMHVDGNKFNKLLNSTGLRTYGTDSSNRNAGEGDNDDDDDDDGGEIEKLEWKFLPKDFDGMNFTEKRNWVENEIRGSPLIKRELLVELYNYYLIKKNAEENSAKQGEILEEFKFVSSPIGEIYFKRLMFFLAGLILVGLFFLYAKKIRKKVIGFDKFVKMYKNGEIHKIVVHPRVIEVYKNKEDKVFFYSTGKKFSKKLKELQKLVFPSPKVDVYYDATPFVSPESVVISVATISITVLGILYLLRLSTSVGGAEQMSDFLGTAVKSIDTTVVKTKFKDVAGLNEQKVEIMEFVEFVKSFEQYQEVGCHLPRGCLLSGPPGCGKTMLAKALAGECEIPFFSISGSEFVEVLVGVGPQRVRQLFENAREKQPCIVFIDEIDAIGSQRGSGMFFSFSPERENTLNQLLVEMDGFNDNDNVVVIAATNRPQILDRALLRPGRFDRRIEIGLPNVKEREEIFEVYLDGLTISGEVGLFANQLSKLSPGCSGADIANICNEAALVASRDGENAVEVSHFETAIDRIIGGLERRKEMDESEREIIAYHEAGHALVGWLLENCDPILKVTIVPRSSGVLGFTQHLPKDRSFLTEKQLNDYMCMILGGRAAEDLIFDHYSTGAQNDLEKVTELAYSMVSELGFNEKIGSLSFPKSSYSFNVERPHSEKISEIIDDEARSLIKEQYKRTFELLNENKEKLKMLVEILLENETISAKQIEKLIGKPISFDQEFDDYLNSLS